MIVTKEILIKLVVYHRQEKISISRNKLQEWEGRNKDSRWIVKVKEEINKEQIQLWILNRVFPRWLYKNHL